MVDREVNVRLRAHVSQYMSGLNQASARTAAMGGRVSRTMRENKAAFTAAGAAAAGFGVATGMALKSAGDAAIDTQATFLKLRTQIGLTAQEADAMRDAAMGMADTGRGVQELGESMFFVASAGLRGQEALEATESAAKAAAIGLGETQEIAGLTTAAMNAYGSEALDATQATDVLLGAVREGSASAEDFAGSLGQVLPIASNMGVAFDEVGAAVAAMTRTGTDAGTATIQLRQILSSLLKPTEDTVSAFEEMGLSAQGVRDTIREDGLWQALSMLSDQVGDNEDALGRLFPNVRALSGFLDLTGESAETTEQIFGSLADTTGLLNEGFEEYSQTAQAAAERSEAAWENAKTQFGEATIGMRANLSSLSEGLATWLGDLDRSTQTTVVHMGTAASAVGTLGGAALIAGPRIVETTRALGGLRRMALGGLGLGAVTFATFELIEAFNQGKQDAQAMLDEIVEGSDGAEEALRKLDAAAQEHTRTWAGVGDNFNQFWNDTSGFFAEFGADAWRNIRTLGIGPLKDEVAALARHLDWLGAEEQIAAEFAEDAAEGFRRWAAEADPLGLTLGSTAANMERSASAADDAGQSAEIAATGFSDLGDSIDSMSGNAQSALSNFGDISGRVLSAYSDTLSDLAEDNDRATDEMADDWDTYMGSLQQTLEDQREWHDNLNRIREVAGDEYADMLAAQGIEQAGLHAEIADQSAEEIQRGADLEQEIRAEAAEEAIAQLHRSGAQIVDTSGELAEEAAGEIADKLGVTPANVRDILAESETVMRAQLESAADAAGAGGHSIVARLAGQFNAGGETLTRIVNQWASGTIDPLNTVIGQIDGEQVVYDASDWRNVPVGGAFAAGGTRDPDAFVTSTPTVLMGEGPGAEAFIPMYEGQGASRERSRSIWRDVGRHWGFDREMAAGGFASLDDVPGVPSMPISGDLPDVTEGMISHTRDQVVAWLEENLAPELGAGIGYQAMFEALTQQFPGADLISGLRPGAVTSTGNRSYHAMGRAIDFDPSREMARWINENYFGQTRELITPWQPLNIRNGSRFSYSDGVMELHDGRVGVRHNHWAMARGGILPSYDGGGLFPAGTMGANTSGEDEAVIPGDLAEGTVYEVPGMGAFLKLGSDWHQATGLGQLAGAEALFGESRLAQPANIGPLQGNVRDLFGGAGGIEDAVANLREWELAQMDATDRLAEMRDALDDMAPFTDEYMAQLDAIERLEGEIASNRQRRIDDLQRQADEAVDSLRDMLAERDRIEQRMADRRAQFAERVAGLRQQHTEEVQQAEERRDESIAQARTRHDETVSQARDRRDEQVTQAEERRDERVAQARQAHHERVADEIARREEQLRFDPLQRLSFEFGNRPGSIADNVRSQIKAVTRSEDLLGGLREQGLDDAVISALGLDDPRQLRTLEEFSRATEDEIAALNDAILDRNATASERAERDAERTFTSLGSTLVDMRSDLDDELQTIHAEARESIAEADRALRESIAEADARMRERMADAREEFGERIEQADAELRDNLTERREAFNDDMAELKEELQAIGEETGRTAVEAIADGINAGLPALREAAAKAERQVERFQSAKRKVDGGASATPEPSGGGGSGGDGLTANERTQLGWLESQDFDSLTGSEQKLLANLQMETFAEGGIVSGSGPQRIVAHGGERIFSNSDNDRLIKAIESMGSGRTGPVQHVDEQNIYDAVDLQAWERSLVQAARIAR